MGDYDKNLELQTDTSEEKKRPFHDAKAYLPIGIAAFGVIGAALLLYFALLRVDVIAKGIKAVLSAMSPVICGFIIAFLLSPVVRFLEKKLYWILSRRDKTKGKLTDEKACKMRRSARRLSIFASLMAAIVLITLLILAIVPEVIASIESLVNEIPKYTSSIVESGKKFLSKNERLSEILMPYFQNATQYIEELVTGKLESIVTTTYGWVTIGIRTVIDVIFTLVIGIIISAYLMGGKEYYLGLCKKLTFAILRKDHAKTVVQTMHRANIIYSSAILGKIVDSIIIGLLCFIGSTILGLFFSTIGEYSILVSIVVGVTNVIPFFGPFIGGVPCTVLIMCMNPIHGLIFGAFLIVLQQFDCNYLDPHIVGKSVGLRPLFVLVACLVLGGIGGIVGMLLATPTFALVYTILKTYFEVKLEGKNLPTDTGSYMRTPGAILVKNSEEVSGDATEDEA